MNSQLLGHEMSSSGVEDNNGQLVVVFVFLFCGLLKGASTSTCVKVKAHAAAVYKITVKVRVN
jgi:hypothetical protein